jgi:menaquinone-dependent protoporphyrinogen oxidase
MRILVSAASKHGSTDGIARVIAEELNHAGHEVVIQSPDTVERLGGFDAAVIGSAVYAGHWMPAASTLIEREAQAFAAIPVWLFSSGPIGDPPKPEEAPVDVARLRELTAARGERVFAGRLDRHALGFAERAICAALRAPEGDFRPWDDIRAWAGEIAGALTEPASRPTASVA